MNGAPLADRKRLWVYGGFAAIFLSSVVLIAVTPAARQTVQTIAGTVGVAALLGALFQLVRDSTKHERELFLKRDEQHFMLGVTSHMADVVFDKHVAFCEAYINKLLDTVTELIEKGPTEHTMQLSKDLRTIRLDYMTWITPDVRHRLEHFESELARLGGEALRWSKNPPTDHTQYKERHDAVSERFQRLLPDLFGQDVDKRGISAAATIEYVRDILGIQQLVEMRSELVRRAHEGLLGGSK